MPRESLQTEALLLEALRRFTETVEGMRSQGRRADLGKHFEEIDALTALLPAGTDPTLLHYLRKKSYEKARLFLEGRDADNTRGNCGHVG